jgi:hypothetical protein
VKKVNFMKMVIAFLIAGAGLYLFLPASQTTTSEPLTVCLLQDLSESAPRNGCPLLSESEFNMLLELVSKTGGEIGFGVISDIDEPLARIRIPLVTNPYQKARLRRDAELFRAEVRRRLERKLSKRTDMVAAMNRANTFLAEGNSKHRYLIVVSDGVHDANQGKPALPIEGAQTFIVSGKLRPKLPNALDRESIGAAIYSIQSKLGVD